MLIGLFLSVAAKPAADAGAQPGEPVAESGCCDAELFRGRFVTEVFVDAEAVDLLVEATEARYVGVDGGYQMAVQGFLFDVPASHGRIGGLVAVAVFLAKECLAVDSARSHQPRQQRFAAEGDPVGTVPETNERCLEHVICQMTGNQRMRQPRYWPAMAVVDLRERSLISFDDLHQQGHISLLLRRWIGYGSFQARSLTCH